MATRATQVVDGAFCAFRRNDVLSAGGWVYWNGEDNEITLRLYRIGFRTRYEPRAVAFEDVPDTYRSLRKQRVRWNRGGVYAHRRHMGALRSGAFEFGGIAILVWVLMFMKGGMRYFIYVYALLITLLAGVATLYTVAFLLILLLVIRGSAIAYYIARLGWWRDLVWIPMWPIASALKQSFAVDAFGTMVPGKGSPEFSE
jgi:cellulose synthase/poly-beta-1,6-N-acetylglucosamine synthase-like glycosyltransferase